MDKEYEEGKKLIKQIASTPEEYERLIKKLAETLNL